MKTNKDFKTVKVPFFNNFNEVNNFQIVGNKFIAEQQIKESNKLNDGLISIGNITTTIRYEFILPENYTQNTDFESDVTITYQIIDNELHLVNIDAQYAEDYIENIESNANIFPFFKNGGINFSSEIDNHTFDTAC